MKCEAKDIIARLNEHAEALGDSLIGLVEDINDSVIVAEEPDYSDYVKKSEYDELKQKYISRFENGDGQPKPEPKKPEPKKRITYADLFEEE